MENIRGYLLKQRKGISHWEVIIEEWLLAVERYCRIMKGDDAPYWYNERSNIGVLAGAAWRCGRIALEEFQYEKGYRNKPKWLGRADLLLASENYDDLVEAKFKWLSLKSRNGISNVVQDVINNAVIDAKKTEGIGHSDKVIGIAFCPVYAKKKDINEIDDLIEDALEDLRYSDHHAIAWCFPKETRRNVSEKGNILPGVFMIIKNAKI